MLLGLESKMSNLQVFFQHWGGCLIPGTPCEFISWKKIGAKHLHLHVVRVPTMPRMLYVIRVITVP